VKDSHYTILRGAPVRQVGGVEIWGFIQKKEGHKGPEEAHDESIGDAYYFVAIERSTKLILNFALGRRDKATTNIFIEGLRHATASQNFQITTGGFAPYVKAVSDTLADRVSFAQLIKVYRSSTEGEARYSPAEVASVEVVPVLRNPDPKRICTSIVERQNLTIRMQMRRLTRLTNEFSKKWENLWAAYCLHFAYYNFCRIHRSVRVTPAMQAGIYGSRVGYRRTAVLNPLRELGEPLETHQMLSLRSLAFILCSAIRRSCALSCAALQCSPDKTKTKAKATNNKRKMATNRAVSTSVSYDG
jgi:IS1 family transposase